jgi:hypothetical protein
LPLEIEAKFNLMKNYKENNSIISKVLEIPEKEYHKEWNNLMEAIEKINSYRKNDGFIYTFVISPNNCIVYGTDGEVANDQGATSLEMAYITVVNFCEWLKTN